MTPGQLSRFVRAVVLTAPATNAELYWLARVTLVRSPEQFDAFDRVFNRIFLSIDDIADSRGDQNAPALAHPRPRGRPGPTRGPTSPGGPESTPSDSSPSAGDEVVAEGAEREIVLALASREERLASTDFTALSEDELRELRRLMRRIRIAVPARAARRHHRHRHGDRLDLRATLRRSRRHGGDPVDHVTRRARQQPRKLVVLCDISGSMAAYSRACVQLLHAATGSTGAEVFTFATRLTRLTKVLAVADPDVAMSRASTSPPDWKSGTRIGDSLKAFIDDYGRRGLARGAVVVIVSDGWDRGDAVVLGEQMARLARLAHRIVWINPRTAADGFEPLTGGMSAALPHCDELVSGHTLVSLGRAMSALGGGD